MSRSRENYRKDGLAYTGVAGRERIVLAGWRVYVWEEGEGRKGMSVQKGKMEGR